MEAICGMVWIFPGIAHWWQGQTSEGIQELKCQSLLPVKMCKESHLKCSAGELLNLNPQEGLDIVQ